MNIGTPGLKLQHTIGFAAVMLAVVISVGCGSGISGITGHPIVSYPFDISVAPTALSVSRGSTGHYTITASQSGANLHPVFLVTASGLPAGATYTQISSSFAQPVQNYDLNITAGSATPLGNSTITLTVTDGTFFRTTDVQLTVTAGTP